ncbi:ATP-binding protein [Aquisalimonas lutea]|uniref:ATP-binding protein n=1 Tax=Aquisalimonas lutea TaxID=1327750 RepID=UPI0025B60012|nr:ATP-binding protein [Aquisalimonas lutea]MDN3519086.1 ATP-binding protein [Aquisalimonas lutea]
MTDIIETTHLRRLIRLRYLVIAGQLVTVLGVHVGLELALPITPMLALIAALAAFNIATQWRLGSGRPVTQREFAAQLIIDIAQLSLLLYLSGGYANPFIFMLLPPLAIAAAALSGWHTGWVVAGAAVCYSVLLMFHVPLPALEALPVASPVVLRQTGMWVCFMVAASVIVFFVLRTRQTLREKDQALAEARDRALRNEHLAVVGSLAAGTAHELGTPLATMSFLTEEMHADVDTPHLRDQLSTLRRQVLRCRDAIDQLAASAGELRASAGYSGDLEDWIVRLVGRWRRESPQTHIALHIDDHAPAVRLLLDRALEQAVSSLISNAVRVSTEVEIVARWDHSELVLDVLDRGPGVPSELASIIGRQPLGQREGVHGMGLGLYLATGTIERLGGRLELSPREGGGTRAHLLFPMSRLKFDDGIAEQQGISASAG